MALGILILVELSSYRVNRINQLKHSLIICKRCTKYLQNTKTYYSMRLNSLTLSSHYFSTENLSDYDQTLQCPETGTNMSNFFLLIEKKNQLSVKNLS